MAMFCRGPLTGRKIVLFEQCLALKWKPGDRRVLSTILTMGSIYSTKRQPMFVAADGHDKMPCISESCLWQQASTFYSMLTPKRTERNLI